MHPVSRPAIVLVKIMRVYSPAIGITTRPARCAKPFIIRSPPLPFPIDAIVVRWLDVKTDDVAMLGHVNALLINVIVGNSGQSTPTRRIRQREEVKQRLPAPINPALWDNVAGELRAGHRINNGNQSSGRT